MNHMTKFYTEILLHVHTQYTYSTYLYTIKVGYSFNKCLKEGLYCASHAASVPPFT